MTAPFSLSVAGQPLPKERPRTVRGRTFTPQKTRDAEQRIAYAWRNAGGPTYRVPVQVTLSFWRADARRVDVDNLAKLVLDALNGTAWTDDHLIVALHAAKNIDRNDPGTLIHVEEA